MFRLLFISIKRYIVFFSFFRFQADKVNETKEILCIYYANNEWNLF